MKVLLIPATDWLRHPVPSRHHHIFETMAETDSVHVIQFDLFPRNLQRETNVVIHRLHAIPSKGLVQYYLFNIFSYWQEIASVVKSERIDVLVVSNLLPAIPTLLGNLRCRIVVDLKDMFADNSAIYYQNVFMSSMIKGASEWLLQRLLRNADHVITVSTFLVNYLKEIGITKISLIRNGADLTIFRPDLHLRGLDAKLVKDIEGSKVIGFVGTLDRWLDFETLLRSLKELSTRYNVKLLVVGGKMVTGYFDHIISSVRQFNLRDRVIFTGFVPHETVPYYVNLMDVCLIPMRADIRLNQARCPDKLFEYLACGKPVVSTRLSEVLRVGADAVRYYDDTSSLTRVISEILENEELQNSMRRAALNIAKNYDWRSIAEKYRETLEKQLV
jgi:glycosyltransferase involved in cell wall biosynthesis